MTRKRTAAAQPQATTQPDPQPAATAAAQPQAWRLAYVGDVDAVGVMGHDLPRGVAVEVPEAVARHFAAHPLFEVSHGDVHAG